MTDNEQTTLKSCPWCAAVPVKTDLAPSQRYRLDHKPTCYLYGQMTGMRGNSHYIFIALNKAEQWNTRVSADSTALVVGAKIYADGYCDRCSELAYPLTRALEATGVPTGEMHWQQTYGPNKVRALSDLETCLRKLLFALEEGKPEEIQKRTEQASHYIEFHAAVRRRLTAADQLEHNAPAAASPAAPQEDALPEWSVEHPNYERAYWAKLGKANAAPTPSQPARGAAEEIWNLAYDCRLQHYLPDIDQITAIISRYFPAAATETVGEREDKENRDG